MEELKHKIQKFLRKIKRKKQSKLFTQSSSASAAYASVPNPNRKSYFKTVFWVLFDIGIVLGIALLIWIFYISSQAPELNEIESSSFSQTSVILDRTGEINLYAVHGEENRKVVPLKKISKHMQDAILAAEDAGFYEHSGVSFRGLARAGVNTLMGTPTGASTLSQQLIKMVIFSKGEETMKEKVERKIKEITLTRKLEKKYSKDRILELYLNKSPFGRNAYGIESAAQAYFGKHAIDLTITESAILAGLPQRPSRFSTRLHSYIDLTDEEVDDLGIRDYEDFKRRGDKITNTFRKGLLGDEVYFAGGEKKHIRGRFDFVIDQMLEKGFISLQEHDQALEEVKTIEIKKRRSDIKSPHFVFFAEDEAEKILKEKLGEEFSEKTLESGGFKIYTSIDYELQEQVQKILREEGVRNANYNIRNGASLVMNPKTGEILAMAGSRDYYGTYIHPKTGETLQLSQDEMVQEMNKIYANISEEEMLKKVKSLELSGNVNVLTSLRQPGSTFKPITYASAFEFKGLSPATVLMDVKTNFGNSAKKYIPRNYDGKFHGPISIRKSLGNSYNIGAVKAGIIAGLPNVYKLGSAMGIHFSKNIDHYGSSISLGSAEIKPLEMGLAFSSFANNGKKVTPVSILKIENANGDVIYESPLNKEAEQIMQEETAFLITDILSDASGKARPTSWNRNLTIPGHTLAAKTGTSTVKLKTGKIAPHDAWVIGYSANRVAVVWTGNNKGWDGNRYGALGNNSSGLGNAGPIFKRVMTVAHAGLPKTEFSRPAGIKQISVSKLSGKIPPEDFPKELIEKDYFNAGNLPEQSDSTLKIIKLVDSSKKLPNEYTPKKAIKEFVYIELHSFFPDKPNWETPVKEWVEENREKLTESLGVKDIIPYVPEETDDTYGPDSIETAPLITILSPANMGIVAPPTINVEAEISAPNGISSLEYFWNGELIVTKNSAPWTTSVHIGDAKIGTIHTLTARVTDRDLFEGETSIQVKIGEDTTPPEISFVSPLANAHLPAQSLTQIGVDAIDRNSAVKQVEFFLNGEKIKTLYQMPFQFEWEVPEISGKYMIKAIATDKSENTAQDIISFTVDAAVEIPENSPAQKLEISAPTHLSNSAMQTTIAFTVPENLRTAENTLELNVKESHGRRLAIYKISGDKIPASGHISYPYTFPSAGEYQIYVRSKGETPQASQKILIHVAESE